MSKFEVIKRMSYSENMTKGKTYRKCDIARTLVEVIAICDTKEQAQKIAAKARKECRNSYNYTQNSIIFQSHNSLKELFIF